MGTDLNITPISDAASVFGAGVGLALLKRSGGFNARGSWSKRIARLVVGLIVLIALRFGLGALFRYTRYVIMVLWATWLTP